MYACANRIRSLSATPATAQLAMAELWNDRPCIEVIVSGSPSAIILGPEAELHEILARAEAASFEVPQHDDTPHITSPV